MAEIKQMIITMRLHIKIISPCALNISSASLSDGDYDSEVLDQNKQTLSSQPPTDDQLNGSKK